MERSQTILMVDDVAMFRELGALFLSRSGFVLTACGGIEALEIARREAPDLVVADLQMPDMDGAALCRAIKQDPSLQSIPVILLLGSDHPKERARAVRAGADDVLAKPLFRDALIATAQRFLRFDPARGLPRVAVAERIQIRCGRRASWGTLRNLSRGGLFVETDCDLDPHTEVDLLFTLPETHTPVSPTAEIVWRRDNVASPPGVGLRFLEVDGETERWLDDFVYERTDLHPSFAAGSAP